MSVHIGNEVWLRLVCDAGNKCKYRHGSGTAGGWEGESEADVFAQAKERGWLVNGDKAICPDCAPFGESQRLIANGASVVEVSANG